MTVNIMNTLWGKGKVALALAGTALICIGITSRVRAADPPAARSQAVFAQYCFQCHGDKGTPMAGVNLSKLTAAPVGDNFKAWQRCAAAERR